MLLLSSPQLLFNRQKVFRINNNVEKKSLTSGTYKIVLVYDYNTAELSLQLKEMIDKIVQACKFNIQEALYINRNLYQDISLGYIQNQFNPGVILVMGNLDLSRNATPFKKNVPYEMNGTKILFTSTVTDLDQVKGEKQALWAVLQRMLNFK